MTVQRRLYDGISRSKFGSRIVSIFVTDVRKRGFSAILLTPDPISKDFIRPTHLPKKDPEFTPKQRCTPRIPLQIKAFTQISLISSGFNVWEITQCIRSLSILPGALEKNLRFFHFSREKPQIWPQIQVFLKLCDLGCAWYDDDVFPT
jgi:hypothetical protein